MPPGAGFPGQRKCLFQVRECLFRRTERERPTAGLAQPLPSPIDERISLRALGSGSLRLGVMGGDHADEFLVVQALEVRAAATCFALRSGFASVP